MGDLFRRGAATFVAGFVGAAVAVTLAWPGVARAQSEPPGRVGRLAFTSGTVSFHDNDQSEWTPAAVNTPLSTGDSLWTEPNARSEISLAGTRIRMAGATELDMLAVDDTQTRLQVDQGRVDIKTQAMDTSQPYQIVTPRGTISLLQQGDYYVEAGSTQDPTQIGVRAGAAQIQGLNGQVLAVRPGEVGEVTGDAATPQLRTIHSAPPPQPAVWADRDRQVSYDQPPQYLTAGVTGYEDLNQYGTWVDDSSYGEVWIPRAVPAGWAPYRTGHWAYEQPWGWTWIDDQPWGFAPYHYGRWANREGRWMWLPPQRDARPVYAPALVAFVGGVELAAALSRQSSAPVGWFPLGPREAYVPPYTTNRDYYQRINRPARVEDQVLNERWQRAERHEPAGEQNHAQNQPQNQQHAALMNQRFATVVPAATFVHSQPVSRAALQVAPDKIAAAPVAPVAAPPAPAALVAAPKAEAAPNAAKPAATPAPAPATANLATAKTAVADMPTFARPAAVQAPAAPGPKFAATRPTAPASDNSKQALPALAPRQGAAPPELKGAVTPAPSTPAPSQPASKPGEPPQQQQAAPQPQSQPHAAPAAEPNHPPVPAPQQQARPEPPKPAEAPHPQAAPQPAPHPQPPQANQPQHPAEAPRLQAAPPPAQANQPPHPVGAPRPQAVPQPQPQHQPAPAQEGHAAPQPTQQPHPAPQPQPQQVQAPHPAPQPAPQPHPAPPPQQAQAPHPAPQPQQQPQPHPAPPPPQAQAPHAAPQPQQQPQPHPAPPPQQAQAPHPAPQPQQQPQPHPAPPPQQAQAPHPASPPQQQHEEKK